MTSPVLEIADLSLNYGGLRPLRIGRLLVNGGEQVALLGLDEPMAQVFVNLITGTTLPDRGDVKIFGRSTATITDSSDWLKLVDRFGIVSERAVLLDALTVMQNLAMPFTLEVDQLEEDVATRAAGLAREAGLPEPDWKRPVATLDPAARARVRFGRALALDPAIIVLEHPTASVDRDQINALGGHIRSVAERRGAATVAVTADSAFAGSLADRVLILDAASGRWGRSRPRP